MPPAGTELNRPKVSYMDIASGMNDVMLKLQSRLNSKGDGAYASRHEIYGILAEEMDELLEALRIDDEEGLRRYAEELLDVAVGAVFGYICVTGHYLGR